MRRLLNGLSQVGLDEIERLREVKAAARALLDRLPICQCDQEMTEEPHFSDCVLNPDVCANEIKALEDLL